MLRLVVWLLVLGAMIYVVFWVLDRRLKGGEPPESRRRPAPPRPSGPDDDEDFIRELDRRHRDQGGDS